ncbi:hypothetical protein Tco_1108928 [Tanacetum coccineum]
MSSEYEQYRKTRFCLSPRLRQGPLHLMMYWGLENHWKSVSSLLSRMATMIYFSVQASSLASDQHFQQVDHIDALHERKQKLSLLELPLEVKKVSFNDDVPNKMKPLNLRSRILR